MRNVFTATWLALACLGAGPAANGAPPRPNSVGKPLEQLQQVLDSFFGFWDETLAKPSAKAGSRQ